ncbi:MAG: tRNA (adenosine(37)-N6)-threonylcarbamoyltransferase complex dimerization subunit type 1 TsaB [Anaerolineae bacterium]|nr:tRNA (adenosine(37)-N6)-threonylcarbamoyltransferase complex dimerization subunit type 1 TsaB [Anaerolineae bacterium]MDW8173439.1 tRNA (adenosine(37)-N6)-threonylcarbamoyltransferase complex dimerization subunit type 1 TsaB [Anaerolineae bacterium]
MYLAIDSASPTLSLALHDGQTILAEHTLRVGNQHNTLLAPAVQHILEVCGVSPGQIVALAVAKGPGSYTGLRIGIALAKGLAGARQLPLLAFSTLDIVAEGAPSPAKANHGTLLAVIAAGRGRIIHRLYTARKGNWIAEGEAAIGTWEALLPTLAEDVLISGEVDATGLALLDGFPKLTLVPAVHRLRRAAVLAQMAIDLLNDTPREDWSTRFAPQHIQPVYLNTASVPG